MEFKERVERTKKKAQEAIMFNLGNKEDSLFEIKLCDMALASIEKEWQPISSAPRDGTSVLLYWPKENLVIRGSWESHVEDVGMGTKVFHSWFSDNDFVLEDGPDNTPTLWMPLPIPEAKP